jgi:hypothetical protein
MNTHALIVHFPIALLSIYAVLELVHHKKVLASHGFFFIKSFLLVVGTLAAFAAAQSGEIAEEAFRGGDFHRVVELHSMWATLTIAFFSILAYAYVITWIRSRLMSTALMTWIAMHAWPQKVWLFLDAIARIIRKPVVCVALAGMGLVAITVTGALGASIVYGPDIDPVVSFVYHLFIN